MSETNRGTLSLKKNNSTTDTTKERLHKVLAEAGLGSRRAIEKRIEAGEITVNGQVAELGQTIQCGDLIQHQGKKYVTTSLADTPSMLMYHKPEGQITTKNDPDGRPTVFDSLPNIDHGRWIAVGRLDINTTGLLLLTNDGELANALMHPSSEIEREYVCRARGNIDGIAIERLLEGIELEDGMAQFKEIEPLGEGKSNGWYRVVIAEGKNREVRRLFEAVGAEVSRLKRVRYGNMSIPKTLRRGECKNIPADAIMRLRKQLGLNDVRHVMTLREVAGERRSRRTVDASAHDKQEAYVQGGYDAEERELRRFERGDRPERSDRPRRPSHKNRQDRGRSGGRFNKDGRSGGGRFNKDTRSGGGQGRGRPGGGGRSRFGNDDQPGNRRGKPSRGHGNAAPKRARPGHAVADGFKTWYVPEGVETTSKQARGGGRGRPGGGQSRGRPDGGGRGRPGGGQSRGRPDGGGRGRPGGGQSRGRPDGGGRGRPGGGQGRGRPDGDGRGRPGGGQGRGRPDGGGGGRGRPGGGQGRGRPDGGGQGRGRPGQGQRRSFTRSESGSHDNKKRDED